MAKPKDLKLRRRKERAAIAETTLPLQPGSPKSPAATEPAAEPAAEPSRALTLADFSPPSETTSERLLRLAYSIGIPGSVLTAPFRKPERVRLLATVTNPLPGNKVAGTAIRAGHFLQHGAKLPLGQIDYATMSIPFANLVHSFGWLDDLAASGSREQVAGTAQRLLSGWLDAHPEPASRPGKHPAWRVDRAANRLLNWLIHAPLLLAGDDAALRNRTLLAAAESARWLDRNIGRAEDALAAVAGWCAITAAGLLLPDGGPRRLYGEAGLLRALGELVGDDGGVLSRSPLGQIEALSLLVRLRACYSAVRRNWPENLSGLLETLAPPLQALIHGDGGLGCWQGAWALAADDLAALIEASGVRTRPLRDVRQWGYQRVAAGRGLLQFDAAPPPLGKQARHGCASTLAFEFSQGSERIVVNCGGAAAVGGVIPRRFDQALRASAAHSALVLDDANSTAVLDDGRLGKGVIEVEVDRRTITTEQGAGATRLEASHDGYASRYGLIHRRILMLRDDGSELRGEDMLVPASVKVKGKKAAVPFAIRFHLGTGVEASLSDDAQGAGLVLPDGSRWQFRSGGGEVAIEDSLWADGQGQPVPVQQLVLQGTVSRGGGTFSWLLKQMG